MSHAASVLRTSTVGVLALVMLAGTAWAAQPATDAGLLSGPEVVEAPGVDSGVRRNLDGTMEIPRVPTFEAALETLKLDAATQEKVQAVLTARAAQIDRFVQDNRTFLEEYRTLRQIDDAAKRREITMQMRELSAPLVAKPTPAEQIAAVLGEADRAAYEKALQEFRTAARQQAVRRLTNGQAPGAAPADAGPDEMLELGGPGGPENDGEMGKPETQPGEAERPARRFRPGNQAGAPPANAPEGEAAPRRRFQPAEGDAARPALRAGRGGAMGEEALLRRDLQLEIARSVEGQIQLKQDSFENFKTQLDLTPEQETALRTAFERTAAARETPDAAKVRRQEMMAFMQTLSPEQREKARELLYGQRQPRP